ncbi:MAG: double-cubane-cluster-containing anaerobic reductase [Thermodesulfovibrionales bacterium]|nr:double-cubane-cluster-containing anaerobic reductase [Thermodesulfovibrionales bacterium]
MSLNNFEVKSYPEIWKALGVDVERFEKMRCVLGDIYQTSYLSQENRPNSMDYFNWIMSEIHGGRITEILEYKKEGRPVVGTFCIFIPEEIVIAVGGICVGLCGGSQGPVPDAEKILPRNICPLVKSSYGFKIAKVCPYFQAVDFVYGETTCDAKKKTWELLDKKIPTYVMEIPQMKRQRDLNLWLEEVKDFKLKIEKVAKREISFDDLAKAIKIVNDKRKALQRLNKLRYHKPSPISGKDVLLIEQIAFFDDPIRFTEKVNRLCDELEDRIEKGIYVSSEETPRVMISGTPMAMPNWKIHNIIESSGAIVVNEESCVGTRYFKDIVDDNSKTIDEILQKLTERYMKIDCSCFTPNDERVSQVLKEFKDSQAQGILHYSLQFCHTYNIEAVKIKEACDKSNIPFLSIESDYSPEDIGQLRTRIEAFIEQIKSQN